MKVKIEKIVYPGKSLSRINGKVLLTDLGLPDELVEVEVLKEKKNFTEARTIDVIEASKHRITPKCSHFQICSPYQYIDYEYQIKLKKDQMKGIFSHDLKIELPDLIFKPSPIIWGYRNKLHLHIINKGNNYSAAYHLQKSHDKYMPIDRCYLISNKANNAILQFLEFLKDSRINDFNELLIRESVINKKLYIVLYSNSTVSEGIITKCFRFLQDKVSLSGLVCIDKHGKNFFSMGDNLINESISGINYYFGPLSFFQINTEMLREMIDDLKKHMKLKGSEIVADTYCGVGTFGLALANKVKNVIGVEISKQNTEYLKYNIQENNISNFTALQGSIEKRMDSLLKKKIDIMIVDPPRSGIGKPLCDKIIEKPASSLFYVSCNPGTLVRDLKTLLSAYNLKHIICYDFFPHTPHIETCCFLEKK